MIAQGATCVLFIISFLLSLCRTRLHAFSALKNLQFLLLYKSFYNLSAYLLSLDLS